MLHVHTNIGLPFFAVKMKREMEYLQGAFESYKSQLHFETDQRWKAKQSELETQYELDLESQVKQQRKNTTTMFWYDLPVIYTRRTRM